MDEHILSFPTSRKLAESEVPAIVEELMGFPSFVDVPRVQLEWLVERSELVTLEPGLLLKPGDIFPGLMVVLQGRMQAYTIQGGQKKIQQENGPGGMTGI